MRFSILVPVYNVEKYLSECLDSILRQSFTNFELICVNDGSTDTSSEILNDYSKKDHRIKVLTKDNQGLLWARRDAIKVASGDYILFIDSDDKYHDLDVLKSINDCLVRHKDPDLLIFDRAELINEKVVYSCPHYFSNERIFEGKDLAELRYNFIARNYLNGIFLKCIKTEILKKDTTDYSMHNPQMAEDVTQSMYFFDKCQRVVFLPSYVYLYRNNNQSMTRVPLVFENLENKMETQINRSESQIEIIQKMFNKETLKKMKHISKTFKVKKKYS